MSQLRKVNMIQNWCHVIEHYDSSYDSHYERATYLTPIGQYENDRLSNNDSVTKVTKQCSPTGACSGTKERTNHYSHTGSKVTQHTGR